MCLSYSLLSKRIDLGIDGEELLLVRQCGDLRTLGRRPARWLHPDPVRTGCAAG